MTPLRRPVYPQAALGFLRDARLGYRGGLWRQGVAVYRLEDHELISLLGRRVRVRKGAHTFEGTLIGPSDKKFPRGPNRTAYGCIMQGRDFQLEFAWWDWKIVPIASPQSVAAE